MGRQELDEDALQRKLRDSRRRFQRRMQRLIEKYSQPFEDDPLVEMATLTYETPQGRRMWGGRLIQEGSEAQAQVRRSDGPLQTASQGHEVSLDSTRGPEAGSKGSDVDASPEREAAAARAVVPAAPQGPLEVELRRKYLTQVDILLQDAEFFERAALRDGKDTYKTLARPATPAPGCRGGVSGSSPGGPAKPASPPQEQCPLHPGSTDTGTEHQDDSLCSLGTDGSGRSWAAEELCDVTISELYAGMLRSMSRLLSAKPACVISTRASVLQAWSCRRRHRWRSRLNRTYCEAGRRSRGSSLHPPLPGPEPEPGAGPLRDCENLLDVSRRKAGFKLERACLEGNKSQVQTSDPGWKELQLTPRRNSAPAGSDVGAVRALGRERRLGMLQWLLSPVKLISGPATPQGPRGERYREIRVRFERLHREYALSPGRQPRHTGLADSWAVGLYSGGPVSPGGSWSFETHRPGLSVRAKGKTLREAFERLGRSVDSGQGRPEDGPSPLPAGPSPVPSPGRPQQARSLVPGSSPGPLRKAASPGGAVPGPRTEPLGCGRNRYDEIKEEFDKLHREYCSTAPRPGAASPDTASAQARHRTDDVLGKPNPDSRSQKLSLSAQWHRRGALGSSAVEDGASAGATRGDHWSPAKRRRLPDPQLRAPQADSWDSPGPDHPAGKRRGESTAFQMDGRSDCR
ncbi:Holliday junction recognition protein isoform X2 [Oryctolagus cuniculus]|uniref:Holliday junction recognition protein isoform X2 n=1 Tax=Oryctolagus cuniculus TaxID=9986 RepID=UPI003879515D